MEKKQRKLVQEGGYTLLIVMLLSATLLTGVMTLAVSGGFAFRTMTTSSKTSSIQYNADILANKAYQLALQEIYSQFQNPTDVANATGMSLSIPLTTTDDSVLINTDIIQNIQGAVTETIQGQSLVGQYYIQPMPTAPPPLANQHTYYLQAVGHIGNQTSVINFVASFTSGPSVPTSFNPYPPGSSGYVFKFDPIAVSQSVINSDLIPYTNSKQVVLSLAANSTSAPGDLNLQPNQYGYNTPLVYGANGNLQALIAGNVSVGTKDALVVEGDLVANQITLQPNSIVKVYGNLYCTSISMSTNSILIVHGNLLSTGDVQLNNQSSVVVDGSAEVAGALTLGVGNGSDNGTNGRNDGGNNSNLQENSNGNNGQGSNSDGYATWSWNGNGNSNDNSHTNAMFDARQGITVAGAVTVDKFSAIEDSGALTVGQSLTNNGFVGADGDVNVNQGITLGSGATLYSNGNLGADSLSLGSTATADIKGTATLSQGKPETSQTLSPGLVSWQTALYDWVQGLSSFDATWVSSSMWTWNPWPSGYSGGNCGGTWLDNDNDEPFGGWDTRNDLSQFFLIDGMFDYGTWIFGHYLSPQGFNYGAFVQGTPPDVGTVTLTALDRLN